VVAAMEAGGGRGSSGGSRGNRAMAILLGLVVAEVVAGAVAGAVPLSDTQSALTDREAVKVLLLLPLLLPLPLRLLLPLKLPLRAALLLRAGLLLRTALLLKLLLPAALPLALLLLLPLPLPPALELRARLTTADAPALAPGVRLRAEEAEARPLLVAVPELCMVAPPLLLPPVLLEAVADTQVLPLPPPPLLLLPLPLASCDRTTLPVTLRVPHQLALPVEVMHSLARCWAEPVAAALCRALLVPRGLPVPCSAEVPVGSRDSGPRMVELAGGLGLACQGVPVRATALGVPLGVAGGLRLPGAVPVPRAAQALAEGEREGLGELEKVSPAPHSGVGEGVRTVVGAMVAVECPVAATVLLPLACRLVLALVQWLSDSVAAALPLRTALPRTLPVAPSGREGEAVAVDEDGGEAVALELALALPGAME
jgi:hypothetical protein